MSNTTSKSPRGLVVAAMSGGVDSSVAAAIYQKRGYEVIGVTLKLKHPDPEFSAAQTCASKNDQEAVESVCEKLKIKHFYLEHYLDFQEKVLRPSWEEYASGRTPNPCTICNNRIKFGKLLEFAAAHGAEKVITGHYAQITQNGTTFALRRGSDPNKDQTYFLYRLTPEQLGKLDFPVGKMTKNEVREIARELELKNSDKKDSQDACFNVPNECFPETLRRLFNAEGISGNFIFNGKVVGRHRGIHQYTIGQRKGLNVALGVPAYVSKIDPITHNVYLTTDAEELNCVEFELDNLNFQSDPSQWDTLSECLIQVRYRSSAVKALITRTGNDRMRVFLSEPLRAVTPGQAAVFYDADHLLGGGIICNGVKNSC